MKLRKKNELTEKSAYEKNIEQVSINKDFVAVFINFY